MAPLHLPVHRLVERTLGTHDGIADIVPHRHRVAGIGEISLNDTDLDQRFGPGRLAMFARSGAHDCGTQRTFIRVEVKLAFSAGKQRFRRPGDRRCLRQS